MPLLFAFEFALRFMLLLLNEFIDRNVELVVFWLGHLAVCSGIRLDPGVGREKSKFR